jgi:predicted GNAT family acetyltransferase
VSLRKRPNGNQFRRANIKDKLKGQGIGEDEAEKRAVQQAMDEVYSGQGGGAHAGGESSKGES